MPKRDAKKFFEIVQDSDRACVDRGEAIVELIRSGYLQKEIAHKTKLSKVAISHLKKCFDNLKGKAREMCKAGTMNRDACYRLAKERVSDQDRDRIYEHAFDLMKKRDDQRSAHAGGPKGRQTPLGQITDKDVKQAIKDVTESKINEGHARIQLGWRFKSAQPHHSTGRMARRQFGREPSLQKPVRIPHIELFGHSSEQIQVGREREQLVSVGIAGKK